MTFLLVVLGNGVLGELEELRPRTVGGAARNGQKQRRTRIHGCVIAEVHADERTSLVGAAMNKGC